MHDDDLFEEVGNCEFGTPKLKLRADLLEKLRAGSAPEEDDLTCDIVLTRLVHGELEAFGTGGKEPVSEPGIELAQRTLRAVLHRLGITLDLPWRNFSGFRTYCFKHDAYGSWQARRDLGRMNAL